MSGIREIIETFIDTVIGREKFYSQFGTVKDIDETKRTCTFVPAGDDAERPNVRLQAINSSTEGIVAIPKVGSSVAVSFVNKNTGFVCLTSEVDKILIDTDLIEFNGGENGGLVKAGELVSKVNNLENKVNTMIGLFNSHTHIASSFGAPTTPPPTLVTGTLTLTLNTDLESTEVKH